MNVDRFLVVFGLAILLSSSFASAQGHWDLVDGNRIENNNQSGVNVSGILKVKVKNTIAARLEAYPDNSDFIISNMATGSDSTGRIRLEALNGVALRIDGTTRAKADASGLTVTGTTNTNNLSVSGNTTLSALDVNGSGTIDTLGVTGTTTTGSLVVNSSTSTQSLTVTAGLTNTKDIMSSGLITSNRMITQEIGTQDLSVAGTATAQDLSITGTATTQDLSIAGTATVTELYVSEDTYTRVLHITGGGDLAERFTVQDAEAAPGMVTCIDPDHPGQLRISDSPYDRTVVGVISGAGGINPGMLMAQEGHEMVDGNHPIALTGRVYVKADATNSAIQPGDLLTTSGTPGHVMKVTDHAQAVGAILGKAMTSLEDDRGLVLMVVALQ